MVGSGNSCTRAYWSPPAATRVRALIGRVASERWVENLLAGPGGNCDGLATRGRSLQEETEFDPALAGIGESPHDIGDAITVPRQCHGCDRLIGLEQRAGTAGGSPAHDPGPFGFAAAFGHIQELAAGEESRVGVTSGALRDPPLAAPIGIHRVDLLVAVPGRDEGNSSTIGGYRRGLVSTGSARQLPVVGAVHGDARNLSRRASARSVDDPLAVRCPGRLSFVSG